jgi:hypothetical protein
MSPSGERGTSGITSFVQQSPKTFCTILGNLFLKTTKRSMPC